MNGTELTQLHSELAEASRALMSRKNHDYTGKDAHHNDALANFRVATEMGLCNLSQSVLIRLTDKVKRLATSTNRPLQVKDEGVRDTVLDLINYAVLFYAAHLETQGGTPDRLPDTAPSPQPPSPPPSSSKWGSSVDMEEIVRRMNEALASEEFARRNREYLARPDPFLQAVKESQAQLPTLLNGEPVLLLQYTGLASDSCQDER